MAATDSPLPTLGGVVFTWELGAPVEAFTAKSGARWTVVELRNLQNLKQYLSAWLEGDAGPILEAVPARTLITLTVDGVRPGKERARDVGNRHSRCRRGSVRPSFGEDVMTIEPWQPPALAPRGGRYDAESRVLFLPDSQGLTTRRTTPPVAQCETALWVRPSSAACFPLHPAAVSELHSRAATLLEPIIEALGASEEDRKLGALHCWRASCQLYAPGRPIRSALNEFVDAAKYTPKVTGLEPAERQAATRAGMLAAWAVVRAATEWTAEVK